MRLAGSLLFLSWLVCWYSLWGRHPFFVGGLSTRHDVRFRSLTYLTAVVLVLWSALLWSGAGATVPQSERVWFAGECAGFVLVGAGQWLMVRARAALKALSNYDLLFGIAQRYVSDGPYRSLRHPMYVGLGMALLGSTLVMWSSFGMLVLVFGIAPLLIWRARLER